MFKWTEAPVKGPRVSCHTLVSVPGKGCLYSLGGMKFNTTEKGMSVHVFANDTNTWTEVPHTSPITPPDRYDHTAVPYEEKIYVWGGQSPDGDLSNYIWCFDTDREQWSCPPMNGSVPSIRYAHAACTVRDTMYIYGGIAHQEDNSSLLLAYKIQTSMWTNVISSGVQERARVYPSITAIEENIYIFGGTDSDKCDTFHVFNTEEGILSVQGNDASLDRLGHSAVTIDGHLYLFGGYKEEDNKYYNSLWKFDTENKEWSKVDTIGTPPSPRGNMGCALLYGKLYVYGGRSMDSYALGDLHVLDCKSIEHETKSRKQETKILAEKKSVTPNLPLEIEVKAKKVPVLPMSSYSEGATGKMGEPNETQISSVSRTGPRVTASTEGEEKKREVEIEKKTLPPVVKTAAQKSNRSDTPMPNVNKLRKIFEPDESRTAEKNPALDTGEAAHALLESREESPAVTEGDARTGVIHSTSDFYSIKKFKSYSMKGVKKGSALIVSMTKIDLHAGKKLERSGGKQDLLTMSALFEDLGYHVASKENVSMTEFDSAMRKFVKQAEKDKAQSLFLILMSHGEIWRGQPCIFTADGGYIYIRDILRKYLSRAAAPQLESKPKVIIVQSCLEEGKTERTVLEVETDNMATGSIHKTDISNYYIAYATQPGERAHRIRNVGSWFVTEINEVFRKKAATLHFTELMAEVRANVEEKYGKEYAIYQVPEAVDCLKKPFYIFPGLK